MFDGPCVGYGWWKTWQVQRMIRPTRHVGVLLAVALGLIILSSFRWIRNGQVPLELLDFARPQQDKSYGPPDEDQRPAKPVIITPLPVEELATMRTTSLAMESVSMSSSSSTAVETTSTISDDVLVQTTSIVSSSTSSSVWYEIEETTSTTNEDLAVQVTTIVSTTSSTLLNDVEETASVTSDDMAVQVTSIVSSTPSSAVWYDLEESPTTSAAENEQQTTSIPENQPPQVDRPPNLEDLLYPSTTTTEARPASPAPTPLSKAIVIGRMSSENVGWVAQDLPDWQHYIYTVDLPANGSLSPTGLRTPINKGRESMPYLTYIIDHYDNLPDISVFLHAHRNGYPAAWHNDAKDYDAVNMLHELQLPFVQQEGYANLRCRADPGCPAEIQPWREPFDADRDTEHIYPFVYGTFFNKTFDQYRTEIEIVATQCCAQFAVSRDQIRVHLRSEYVRWRQFVIETEFSDALIGRVLEYMWHIIFGRQAVQCTEVRKCWCEVFGRCDDWAVKAGGG
ncbi:hypothetical protein LTR86_006948 [Recurvomyces mirabilis]|nr:hypothetical protein LTR86_006948 [Recurvomyces mirabilis]